MPPLSRTELENESHEACAEENQRRGSGLQVKQIESGPN